jgi:hypothetical protein
MQFVYGMSPFYWKKGFDNWKELIRGWPDVSLEDLYERYEGIDDFSVQSPKLFSFRDWHICYQGFKAMVGISSVAFAWAVKKFFSS